jgi:hypothetical protein
MTKKLVICIASFEYMALIGSDEAAVGYADEASIAATVEPAADATPTPIRRRVGAA